MLWVLLAVAGPVHAVRIAGIVGKPVTLTPVLAVPALTTPLLGTFPTGPGAVFLPVAGVFGAAPSPPVLPTLLPTAQAAAPQSVVGPAVGNTRISHPAKAALRAAVRSFSPETGALNALFDGAQELPDGAFGGQDGVLSQAGNTAEELSFAAKASWHLGRLADDIGFQRGQTSGKMSTHDFLDLLKDARDRYLITYENMAPTPASFKAGGIVIDSVIRVVAAIGEQDQPLHNLIRRILSVWQIFNQAMEEGAERGTLGDVIGEAKLFAHQVEESVKTQAPLRTTNNGIVETADIETGLKTLRDASHPLESNIIDLLDRIKRQHPQLPLDPERVFLLKDQSMLDMLDLPSDAAGAARILSDGKRRENIILLVAPKGIAADDFVEFVIHESVHLMDGGILHVEHGRAIEHWLAEGYTQLRAHEMANSSLEQMGRHARKNPAYNQEVTLARAFISKHGTDALEDLVRNGSHEGIKSALGGRWTYVEKLMAFDNRSAKKRENLLNALYSVVMTPAFNDEQFAYLVDRFNLSASPRS